MYQMAILLQFNQSTSWTVAQLNEATGVKMDLLLQVLAFNQIFILDADQQM